MSQVNHSLNEASKGARVGILVYLVLSIMKLSAAYIVSSSSLRADGLNNLTDIISSVVIFVGLQIAKQPADSDHHYGHSKFESIASFVTSLIMFMIGFEVLKSGIERFIANEFLRPNMMGTWVAFLSAIILYIAQCYIKQLAIKANSLGLKASAKDMWNDLMISISTGCSIIGATFGFPQIDTIMSLFVGAIIIKTAYDIFKESTFTLSDGFDAEALESYRQLILKHPKVKSVTNLKGRLCGSQIYVDVTIEIDGSLTVIESHQITEDIERILAYNYSVREVDVHVEPFWNNNRKEE